MEKAESANSIADEAARWAVRAAYGEMTPESRAELELWLAADRRHRGAYLRAQAGLIATEDAVVRAAPINDNTPSERALRRTWLFGAALAACLAGAAVFGVWQLPFDADSAPQTTLADGSTAVLEDGARIDSRMEPHRRTVTVQNGMATFHVAHDKARPFVVRAGDVYAQATGTVYSVRKVGAAGGTVDVREGTVLVWAAGGEDRAVLLHAGEALTLNPAVANLADTKRGAPSLTDGPAGEISLDNISISAAAARFNAVNRTKVIVEDPRIGNTAIVGLFDADDPEGFARAAAMVTGARVVRRDGRIVIEM